MQDPENPPVNDSQDQIPEGTDIDTIVKQAQDARRMQEAFGVQPDKPVTDAQLNRLQELQGAMDVQEGRIADRAEAEHWGENYFIESDKPQDPAQAEVVQQSDDMEELSKLFGETSDKEHQEAAWKLFDEFVDKHNLSREEERARRNYFLGVGREAPSVSEAQPEPIPEPSSEPTSETPTEGTETSTPTETETPPETVPTEGSEASPDGSTETSPSDEVGGEASPESGATNPEATPPEGATTETEPTAEGDSESGTTDTPDDDAERGAPIPFGGVEGSDLSDSEYSVEETGDPIDFHEASDEEKEKSFTDKLKGMWARVKSAPAEVAASIESYFVAGTPEQNEKNKRVAIAAGVAAIAACIAVEIFDKSGSAHQVSGNIIHGVGGAHGMGAAFQPIASHSSGPDVLKAVTEHAHSSGEGIRAFHEHLGSGGDSIWNHARDALRQYGAKASNHNIFKLTLNVLKDNGLTWESARHLPDGYRFTINPPAWLK